MGGLLGARGGGGGWGGKGYVGPPLKLLGGLPPPPPPPSSYAFAKKNLEVTGKRINFTFDSGDMLLSARIGFCWAELQWLV